MIKVRGYSDDNIVVEGGRVSDEFNVYDCDENNPRYLAFSDGTLLSCMYASDGCWRFGIIQKGTSFISKDECVEDADDRYSDYVYLGEDIKWVVFGQTLIKARKRG